MMDFAIPTNNLRLESVVTFPEGLVEDHLEKGNFLQLSSLIKDMFQISLNDDGCPVTRMLKLHICLHIDWKKPSCNLCKGSTKVKLFRFCEQTVQKLVIILTLYEKNNENYSEEQFKKLLTETAKALRTYAITEETRQYLNNYEFYENMGKIIKKLTLEDAPQLYHKFIFQLLLNILTLEEAVSQMHNALFESFCAYFIKFTSNCFECYETSALIWNLTRLHLPIKNKDLIQRVIHLFVNVEEPNEYLGFLVAKFATEEFFWENYNGFSAVEKNVILGILRTLWYKKHIQFPTACFDQLIKTFKNTSNVITTLVHCQDPDAVYEVAVSVELLSNASSSNDVLFMFDEKRLRKNLLVCASALLLVAHKCGKMTDLPDNRFTPIVKLGQFRNPTEELKKNPAFGFKADLVRLIGNLCYQSKAMQDLARQADVIPVLLDCCNMDAKNPFIIQWVTLAIRNLCEDNLENQRIIASLQREGVVRSEILEEMGLEIKEESDRVLKVVKSGTKDKINAVEDQTAVVQDKLNVAEENVKAVEDEAIISENETEPFNDKTNKKL